MEDEIILFLKSQKKKTIPLTEIQKIFPGSTDYEFFAQQVKLLEDKNILKAVSSHKTNNKSIPLYNTYRINTSHFKDRLVDEIQSYKLKFNENINLDSYLSLEEKEWKKDFEFIKKVDDYIKKNGLPYNESSPQEISYKLIGSEKWIDEEGGKTLLNRINIWDKLKISYNKDPLMLAINPENINKSINLHMIVENKATFYDFLYSLHRTNFTSIIYGSGWKIISNISMLEKQLGTTDKENKVYYFGDFDYEGISIWNRLNEERTIFLATEFYIEFFKKVAEVGKQNQNKNVEALENFMRNFNEKEKIKIEKILKEKCYYPQESLNKDEIETIWGDISDRYNSKL